MTHAQTPQCIPYQAVARNSSGVILASTAVSVRFTIRDSIATGAIKYRETHSLTTTEQGMFSVKVGQGAVVSGTFSSINWGTNAKFMQVEMDPAGGSSYIDMGTTQMMSVPYALNSGSLKLRVSTTGDTLYSGGGNFVIIPGISAANNPPYPGVIAGPSTVCAGSAITVTDYVSGGTWSSSTSSVATIGSTGIVSGVSAGTTIISYTVTNSFGSSYATKVITVNPLPTAGTITGTATVNIGSTTTLSNTTIGGTWSSSAAGIAIVGSAGVVTGVAAGIANISYTVTNSCGSAVVAQVVTVTAAALTVGSSYGGGVVAYIYVSGDPGYVSGEVHGLIAAPNDQSTGIQWGCYGAPSVATSTALGTGAANTAAISTTCGAGTAARLCDDLVLGGYSDWCLPSRDELEKLYLNQALIGGFSTALYSYYWSSTGSAETYPSTYSHLISFSDGWYAVGPRNDNNRVRAIRYF